MKTKIILISTLLSIGSFSLYANGPPFPYEEALKKAPPWPQTLKVRDRKCGKIDANTKALNITNKQKIHDQVDLDNDGVCELIIEIVGSGGTGGYHFQVAKLINNKYESIGWFQGYGYIFLETHNGFAQIEHIGSGGNYYTRILVRNIKGKYGWYRADDFKFDSNSGEYLYEETRYSKGR